MGLDAEVLAIGPFKSFTEHDLDYVPSFYQGVAPEDRIICSVAMANTTGQSEDLAAICCTFSGDLGAHKVKKVDLPPTLLPEDWIGEERVGQVVARLSRLLEAGCELWYRPNG